MSKLGIILNSKIEAEALNHAEAQKRGCTGTTQFWYSMRELTTKTSLQKDVYAELFNIPATIIVFNEETEEEEEIDNPEYVALENSIEVSKYALITDENITESDGEEETILYEAVDIDEYLPVVESED
jgi:hypothetical protein